MNKKLIIFTSASLLWCFALGFFVLKQVEVTRGIVGGTILPASVILSQKQPATVLVFGDMMLDRNVRKQINANGYEYPFAKIKDLLNGNDVVVANAEGPFTSNKSVTLGIKDAPLTFTFDPKILPTLKNLGFTLLGQANNHTLNFGMAGFRQSTSSIETAGLNWFGDPRNKEVKPYITEVKGQKIAFIGYHEFAYQGLNNVLQAIRDVKNKDVFVIVSPHWGEEYNMSFTSAQQKTAHAFIDAGADAVIGTHPHVVEPVEIYNNKIIFYSLGNFVFDQWPTGPTSKGLAVKISLTPYSATYDLFPISILRQQAALMTADDGQKELDLINVSNGQIVISRLD